MKLIDHGHRSDQVGAGEEATSVARGGGTGPELRRAGVSRLECIPSPGEGREAGVEAGRRPLTLRGTPRPWACLWPPAAPQL